MEGHSPLPWQVSQHENEGGKVLSPSYLVVANCLRSYKQDAAANAAFIVRAVNAHDELVAALRRLVEANRGFELTGGWLATVTAACAALARVEGREP